MNEQKSNKNTSQNSLLLTLIPGYAYLLAFAYEYGYCSFFGIPKTFISPNLNSILLVISIMILIVLANITIWGFLTPFLRALENPKLISYRSIIAVNFFYIIMLNILIFLYGLYWSMLTPFLISWFFFGGIYFLPALFKKKNKTLSEKFDEYNKEEDYFSIIPFIFKYFSLDNLRISVFALVIVGIAYLSGNSEAYKQKVYYTSEKDSTFVFLRNFDDKYIFTTINYDTKTFSKKIKIINSSELSKLNLKLSTIGQLSESKIEKYQKDVNDVDTVNSKIITDSTKIK